MAPPRIPRTGPGNTSWLSEKGTPPDLHSDKAETGHSQRSTFEKARRVDGANATKKDKDQKDQNNNDDNNGNGGSSGGSGQSMTAEELAQANAEIKAGMSGRFFPGVNKRVYVLLGLTSTAMAHTMAAAGRTALMATLSSIMARMTVSRVLPALARIAVVTSGAAVAAVATVMLTPSTAEGATISPLQRNRSYIRYYAQQAQAATNPFKRLEYYMLMYSTLFSYMLVLDAAMNAMLETAGRKHRSLGGRDADLINKTTLAVRHYRQAVHDVAKELTEVSNTADRIMGVLLRRSLHRHQSRILVNSHFKVHFTRLESEASQWYTTRATIGATRDQVVGYLNAGRFPI